MQGEEITNNDWETRTAESGNNACLGPGSEVNLCLCVVCDFFLGIFRRKKLRTTKQEVFVSRKEKSTNYYLLTFL